MTDTIQGLIDKALVRPDRVRSGKWSPSSFGRCFRNQYWNRLDEPQSNPVDARTLRVFKCGELFEQFVKEQIIKNDNDWIDCGKRPIECEDVLGFADLLNYTADEVADVKSQHSKAFWYMAKFKGDDIKKEKYSNWLQVGYYARELKKKFMRLVFVSKDDLCIQEYVQPLDEYWLAQIDIELSTLRMLWEQEELPLAEPRCEPNKKGEYWECAKCNWRDKCKKIEELKALGETVIIDYEAKK